MDTPYELPLPELPVPPQASPAQPDLPINGIAGDPLCQILGHLEASIEQPVSGSYPDPLCNTLDKLEASIEQQRPVIDCSPDPINETLSQLEKKIESQHSVAPKKDLPEETSPMQDSFPQTNRQSRFPSALLQRNCPKRIYTLN